MQMPMNWAGYPPMQQMTMQHQMAAQQQAAMGGSYPTGFYPSQGSGAMGMQGGTYCQQNYMACECSVAPTPPSSRVHSERVDLVALTTVGPRTRGPFPPCHVLSLCTS